jgi:Flp pilus assembly protein TadG
MTGRRLGSRSRSRSRGQALVEFAIVLPMFVAMLFGILDLGRVVWANSVLAHAASEAARHASVTGSPSKEAIRSVARQFATAGGANMIVQVCYGAGCDGDTDTLGASATRGTPVTVTIASQVNLVTGAVAGFGTFHVRGSSMMLVNRS